MIRGRDQERTDDSPAEEMAVDQDRQQRAECEREQNRRHRHHDRRDRGVAEELVARELAVVANADEPPRGGRIDRPIREAVVDVQNERDLRDDDREEQCRQQRQAPTPRPGELVSGADGPGRGVGNGHVEEGYVMPAAIF